LEKKQTIEMSNICNFFVKGNCRNGNECKFIHDKNICRFYFLGGYCKRGNVCLFSHEFTIKGVEKKENTKKIDPIEKMLIESMQTQVNRFRDENGGQMSYSDMRRLFG
jgi:hypothetical protein